MAVSWYTGTYPGQCAEYRRLNTGSTGFEYKYKLESEVYNQAAVCRGLVRRIEEQSELLKC